MIFPKPLLEKISTLACGIITKSDVLLLLHELCHGIFLAEVAFHIQMKSPQFSRAALNNCQIVSRRGFSPCVIATI
jgi:hypothetical protein